MPTRTVLGNAAIPELNPDNPLVSVMEYFQKTVTTGIFGAPLQFSGICIKFAE